MSKMAEKNWDFGKSEHEEKTQVFPRKGVVDDFSTTTYYYAILDSRKEENFT